MMQPINGVKSITICQLIVMMLARSSFAVVTSTTGPGSMKRYALDKGSSFMMTISLRRKDVFLFCEPGYLSRRWQEAAIPCAETGLCIDYSSPQLICIIEGHMAKGHIQV